MATFYALDAVAQQFGARGCIEGVKPSINAAAAAIGLALPARG